MIPNLVEPCYEMVSRWLCSGIGPKNEGDFFVRTQEIFPGSLAEIMATAK